MSAEMLWTHNFLRSYIICFLLGITVVPCFIACCTCYSPCGKEEKKSDEDVEIQYLKEEEESDNADKREPLVDERTRVN